MATPQLSPGVLVREVDLTVGRADNVLDNIGAIAGPFAIGPVDDPVDISTEQQLINVFGKPSSKDAQYEYWMSASSFLSYGGVLKVVRTSGSSLVNANAARLASGISTVGVSNLLIKNFDEYESEYASNDNVEFVFAAKTPGTWSNNLKVCVIDDKADQILKLGSTVSTAQVGYAVTTRLTNVTVAGVGTTSLFNGYLKSIITGISTTNQTVDVKIVSTVSSAGVEAPVDYATRDQLKSFLLGNTVSVISDTGASVGSTTLSGSGGVLDWYDQQTLGLSNSSIFWKSLAPKPTTNQYVAERSGRNDSIHIAIVDDTGEITGIQGNLLEKHLFLSKATDSISAINSPQKIWWKEYLAQFSEYVYAGDNPSDGDNNETVYQTGFSSGFVGLTTAAGLWNTTAQDSTFGAIGNVTYTLSGGADYGVNKGMAAQLSDLSTSYRLFSNKDQIQVDYLIMGPGLLDKSQSQAKAQELISIANARKDCIAVISPHREDVVDRTNTEDQTNEVIEFFSPLSSSSYTVFDTGYKYTYDRFNNKFRYIPCNADIAGLMVRTSLNSYPWYSPAGQQRGILNNAIKLAYNPSKDQRDRLYPIRINSIINQPGIGILLFGDKTALGYASAFDRINVRRLFLTVEQALERTAQAQLFELNDPLTRANFVNIVEPYLRDVQAKRGLFDFRVICDETNNTPEVIDNNEFRADIFLKPTKSINYVTLTFVATRTGISFEEVTGRV
jgi:hypothetical protein